MIGTSRTPDAIRGHVGAHCYQAPVTRIGCAPLSALRLQAGQAHVTQIPERRPICSGMAAKGHAGRGPSRAGLLLECHTQSSLA